MSFFNSLGRSAGRGAPRPPQNPNSKRSPSPASASFPQDMPPAPPPPRSPANSGARPNKPLYLCSPFVDAALVKGNFKTIVVLPKYVDVLEWVAVNIFDFYNNLNLFYGIITEFCHQDTCPTMSAGPNLNYTWINADRKHVHLPAPTYIDYVMTWVQKMLEDDENLSFPTKAGVEFPANFPSTAKHIYRQLLRVFAHIYHAHYEQILHLRSEPHFNSLFAHFLAFGTEYKLLDVNEVKGKPEAPVGVGELWERWREMGVLEGSGGPSHR